MDFLQNLKAMTLGGEKVGTIDFNQGSLYSASRIPVCRIPANDPVVSAATIAFQPIWWK